MTRLHGCPRCTRSEQGCRRAARHAGRESEPRGDPEWARLCAASAPRTHAGAVSWEKQTLGSRAHVATHHMQSRLRACGPCTEIGKSFLSLQENNPTSARIVLNENSRKYEHSIDLV